MNKNNIGLPKFQLIKPNYFSLLLIMAFVRHFVPDYGKCASKLPGVRTREFGVDCIGGIFFMFKTDDKLSCSFNPRWLQVVFYIQADDKLSCSFIQYPLVSKRPKRIYFFWKACCSTISCRTREFGVDCRWCVLHSDG